MRYEEHDLAIVYFKEEDAFVLVDASYDTEVAPVNGDSNYAS